VFPIVSMCHNIFSQVYEWIIILSNCHNYNNNNFSYLLKIQLQVHTWKLKYSEKKGADAQLEDFTSASVMKHRRSHFDKAYPKCFFRPYSHEIQYCDKKILR
jgi:hypothetical protein